MEHARYGSEELSAQEIADSGWENENRIRKLSKEGCLLCQDLYCEKPVVMYRHGNKKEAHFAHREASEKCDYAKFEEENLPFSQAQSAIAEQLRKEGYSISTEKKLLPHHYTNIVVDMENGVFAIDLMSDKMSASVTEDVLQQYSDNQIDTRWVVVSDDFETLSENRTNQIRRCLLNINKNNLLIIDYQGERVCQYRPDLNEEYRTDLYREEDKIDNLTISDGEVTIKGFEQRYVSWVEKKRRQIEAEKQEREARSVAFTVSHWRDYFKSKIVEMVCGLTEETYFEKSECVRWKELCDLFELSCPTIDNGLKKQIETGAQGDYHDTYLKRFTEIIRKNADGNYNSFLKDYEDIVDLSDDEVDDFIKEKLLDSNLLPELDEEKRRIVDRIVSEYREKVIEFRDIKRRKINWRMLTCPFCSKEKPSTKFPGDGYMIPLMCKECINEGKMNDFIQKEAVLHEKNRMFSQLKSKTGRPLLELWKTDGKTLFEKYGRIVVGNIDNGNIYKLTTDIEKAMNKYHGNCYGCLRKPDDNAFDKNSGPLPKHEFDKPVWVLVTSV